MPKILALLLPFLWLTRPLVAQTPIAPDSVRVVVLTDVAVGDNIARLVVASGEVKRNMFHQLAPGGGLAVQFGAPRGGYHLLSSVRVHLFATSAIKEGKLRVRAASVTADGSPADDDLLPAPVVLTTAALQHSRKNLLLSWPTDRVLVPAGGFFLVIEGLGRTPDEYVSEVVLNCDPKQPPQYELHRHTQPDTAPRLADIHNFPALMGAEPAPTKAENWYRDTVTQQWRRSPNAKSVVFLEAVFE